MPVFPKRFQCFTLIALITLGVGAKAVNAGIPALEMRWFVNGVLVYDGLPGGTDNGNGTFHYVGGAADTVGADPTFATLSWNITGDPDPQISGNLVVENPFMPIIEVVLEVLLPIAPLLPGGTELLGSAGVGLTTDSNGGTVASINGVPIWQALIDGAPVTGASLFFAPFELSNSGLGSSSSSANFGIPIPVIGPAALDTIGIRISFSVTQNDQVGITSVFRAVPGPGGLLLLGLGAIGARRRRRN